MNGAPAGVFVSLHPQEYAQLLAALQRRGLPTDGTGARVLLLEAARPSGAAKVARAAMDYAAQNPEAVRTLGSLARAFLVSKARAGD